MLLDRLSHVKPLQHVKNIFKSVHLAYPPGHFYSPICNPETLIGYRDSNRNGEVPLPGIDLNLEHQMRRLQRWSELEPINFPKHKDHRRYYWNNSQYELGDATSLSCFIRELKPKRFIEVGSGFSSACILDTLDHEQIETKCTFIDPRPTQLLLALTSADRNRVKIISDFVQNVPLPVFEELEAGDILFIDSTHILKTCSDLAFELFEVLPIIKPGVMIHFHDIQYPFEYPALWINRNVSWNEIYALRAFLTSNSAYQIEFWNDHLVKTGNAKGWEQLRGGASLWISKL